MECNYGCFDDDQEDDGSIDAVSVVIMNHVDEIGGRERR